MEIHKVKGTPCPSETGHCKIVGLDLVIGLVGVQLN